MTDDEREMQDWPDILRRLAHAVGRELVLKLADRFGGVHGLWIPREYNTAHLWAAIIPEKKWPAVALVCGGTRVSLPRGVYLQLRKRRILELAEQGVHPREICLTLGVSQRYVERTIAGLGFTRRRWTDPRQIDMFGKSGE